MILSIVIGSFLGTVLGKLILEIPSIIQYVLDSYDEWIHREQRRKAYSLFMKNKLEDALQHIL